MRLYQTGGFTGVHSKISKNKVTYVVFTDDERNTIKNLQAALKEIQVEQKSLGKITRWNKLDDEALDEILMWPLPLKDGGKHTDLSVDQIDKIDKMLTKLNIVDMEPLLDLLGFTLDTEEPMTDREMRKEMDRRRELAAKHKAETSRFGMLFRIE